MNIKTNYLMKVSELADEVSDEVAAAVDSWELC